MKEHFTIKEVLQKCIEDGHGDANCITMIARDSKDDTIAFSGGRLNEIGGSVAILTYKVIEQMLEKHADLPTKQKEGIVNTVTSMMADGAIHGGMQIAQENEIALKVEIIDHEQDISDTDHPTFS